MQRKAEKSGIALNAKLGFINHSMAALSGIGKAASVQALRGVLEGA
ncbi:hypothetical protein BO068_004918 [Escherichia coli]|nr:hypothetical protein [Escherichia coli]EFG9152759.1 hypothetical protein [Escherichia coli]